MEQKMPTQEGKKSASFFTLALSCHAFGKHEWQKQFNFFARLIFLLSIQVK